MGEDKHNEQKEGSPTFSKDQYLRKDLRFIYLLAFIFIVLIFGMWWYDSTQGIFQTAGGSLLDFLM